jgi:subtilisin family serine protease
MAGRSSAASVPLGAVQQQGWAPFKVGAPAAWATPSTTPITIAVVDTGVDPTQPELAGKLVAGYDVATRSPSSSDAGWHGTAIASIAAGASSDPYGLASYCRQCSVMPVKVLDANGHGSDLDIARGVRWAVDHGARIVNLSLEGPTEDPSLPAAIRYARRKGVVVIAAAGNDGSSARAYPAAEPSAIGVAATDPADRLYPWSNRGPWVTIAAPGINLSAVPGGGVFPFMGTSSAAALVSGVAGLCLSAAPDLTPALVRRALVGGAAPIARSTFGRVDAARTVALCRRYSHPSVLR